MAVQSTIRAPRLPHGRALRPHPPEMGAQMGLTQIPAVGASCSATIITSIRDHFLHDQGHRGGRAMAAPWATHCESRAKACIVSDCDCDCDCEMDQETNCLKLNVDGSALRRLFVSASSLPDGSTTACLSTIRSSMVETRIFQVHGRHCWFLRGRVVG